jgi:Plant transposon protein
MHNSGYIGVMAMEKYRGAWLLVDGGYLNWSVTVPPTKIPITKPELLWSEWLESLRKDVECTFGILKGRWRILKTGIHVHGVEAADNIWLTCCALHNLLLESDGLSNKWEQGERSDWEDPWVNTVFTMYRSRCNASIDPVS